MYHFFEPIRIWKNLNTKRLNLLSLCVSSFQCAAQANLWPSYVFYWNLFVPIKLYKMAINSLEHHTRKKKHSKKSNDTCCWKETSLSITLRQRNTHLYVIYKSQLIYIPSLCLIRWGARRGAFSFKNAREKKLKPQIWVTRLLQLKQLIFKKLSQNMELGRTRQR